MLCSYCGKREVEVLIKQVVNQEAHDLNLCRECAEEMGFISPDVPSITISFSLNETDVQKQKKIMRAQSKKAETMRDALSCPACKMEYREFRVKGLLGCPKCYESFRFPLGAYLQRIQGAESHWGGMSDMFDDIKTLERRNFSAHENTLHDERQASIKRLREDIADAVSSENYERAAELRDTLKRLLPHDGESKHDG